MASRLILAGLLASKVFCGCLCPGDGSCVGGLLALATSCRQHSTDGVASYFVEICCIVVTNEF